MSKKEINSNDVKIQGAEKEFSIEKPGSIQRAAEVGLIDTDKITSMDQIEYEKFMHDQLEVEFADPANENEAQFAEVTVNGQRLVWRRDAEQLVTMPRKHVEVLAHAKVSRVEQKKTTLPDGSQGYAERVVTKLMYPFSVVNDPSRRGRDWLKQQIAMPA